MIQSLADVKTPQMGTRWRRSEVTDLIGAQTGDGTLARWNMNDEIWLVAFGIYSARMTVKAAQSEGQKYEISDRPRWPKVQGKGGRFAKVWRPAWTF
jgi:hypothetical protein